MLQDGRFCHKKHGVSVCCEHVDKVLVKHGNPDRGHSDEDAQPSQNPLKYTPSANSISSSPVLSEVNTPASQSSKLLKLQKLYLDGTAKVTISLHISTSIAGLERFEKLPPLTQALFSVWQ